MCQDRLRNRIVNRGRPSICPPLVCFVHARTTPLSLHTLVSSQPHKSSWQAAPMPALNDPSCLNSIFSASYCSCGKLTQRVCEPWCWAIRAELPMSNAKTLYDTVSIIVLLVTACVILSSRTRLHMRQLHCSSTKLLVL